MQTVTAAITTRNRHESLQRCVDSLLRAGEAFTAILIVDDASSEPVASRLDLRADAAGKVRIIRHDVNHGYIVARNTMAREAKTEFVLFLDDDTELRHPAVIRQAVDLMQRDATVAAVAFAQEGFEGEPWPAQMQPSPVDYPCLVPSYIGFAHLLRRELFLKMGGYREIFHYYGEEKEYCLRLWDAGCKVVYVPNARIAHLPDPSGRDNAKYHRYYTRNDCLAALFSLPLSAALFLIVFRLLGYRKVQVSMGLVDPGGLAWVKAELRNNFKTVWRQRKPVRWSTLFLWRRLRREWLAYLPPASPGNSNPHGKA